MNPLFYEATVEDNKKVVINLALATLIKGNVDYHGAKHTAIRFELSGDNFLYIKDPIEDIQKKISEKSKALLW